MKIVYVVEQGGHEDRPDIYVFRNHADAVACFMGFLPDNVDQQQILRSDDVYMHYTESSGLYISLFPSKVRTSW